MVRGEHGEGLLPFRSLGTNGPDAVTIESYTLVDWNAGRSLDPDSKNTDELRKLSVVDSEGNMLGHIHDLSMDSFGHIDDVDVRTEGVFGIGARHTSIPRSNVRAVGPNLITVEADSSGSSAATRQVDATTRNATSS